HGGLLRQEGDPGPELCRRDLARVAPAEQHRSRVGLEEGRERARERALAAARGTLDGDGLAGPYQDRCAIQDPATLAHHHELSRLERPGHFADAAVAGSVVMPESYRSAQAAIGSNRPAPSPCRRTPGHGRTRALAAGEPVLIVATQPPRSAFAQLLRRNGCRVEEAVASGQLTMLDAQETLLRFMVGNEPDAERFYSVLGEALQNSRAQRNQARV